VLRAARGGHRRSTLQSPGPELPRCVHGWVPVPRGLHHQAAQPHHSGRWLSCTSRRERRKQGKALGTASKLRSATVSAGKKERILVVYTESLETYRKAWSIRPRDASTHYACLFLANVSRHTTYLRPKAPEAVRCGAWKVMQRRVEAWVPRQGAPRALPCGAGRLGQGRCGRRPGPDPAAPGAGVPAVQVAEPACAWCVRSPGRSELQSTVSCALIALAADKQPFKLSTVLFSERLDSC